ncbi:MAG: DUF1573 domain-containing protein [Bacteroidales bacterium]|nr:DUF1573 domain-containing protein [Bacteroidales bacterium]
MFRSPRRIQIFAPLVLAFVTPAVALAQTPATPWANKLFLPNIGKNPALDAPPVLVHDFGTVPHGTLCVHKFTLTNIYDVPMQVVDVRKSCGCLEAYPPQKVLQPQESAEFVVSMNTAKFHGANAQTLYITLGPNYVSTAVIRMQANSRADVSLNPGVVNFGTVAQGAKTAQTVMLEYNGRQRDWKVTEAVPTNSPLNVEIKDVSGRAWFSPTKYALTVSLKPDAPAGVLSEVISLKTTDPTAPIVQVNVTGVVEAPLSVSAEHVRFERVPVGGEASQKIVIRAATGPFKIQPMAPRDDGIIVETFPAPAPVQIVTIRFRPTQAGSVRQEIRLVTDLGGGTVTTIRVEGEGVAE